MSLDARDIGSPGEKEWQELRASYSAAFLFIWLLHEAGSDLTVYVNDLHERFMMAWDIADSLDYEEEEERYIPLPNTLEDITDNVWISDAEAHRLYEQLFPYGHKVEDDFRSAASGLAVVAVHAALETYAKSIGVDLRRATLPKAIAKYLNRSGSALDADAMQYLVELDETRHVIVHSRGVVTDRYVNNVTYNRLIQGELKRVGSTDLDRFASIVWNTAARLRARV